MDRPAGQPPRPTISVVIPARNEAATIAGAIEPLLGDASGFDVEVIVADGRSTDGTRAVVEALAAGDPRVRIVDNATGTTPDGLNAAIGASSGEIIVRMDGHAVPAADYLTACVEVLERSGAWNVGGAMIKTGETRAARAVSAGASSPFGIGGGSRYHLATEAVDLPHVWLGCWPRWVFQRVGLFDPELLRNQDEELDRRILDAGGTIRFDPSISAVYLSRKSWMGIVRQYLTYGTYRVRAVQKHPSMLRLRHLIPPALVGLVVLSALAAIVVPVAAIVVLGVAVAWLAAATYFAWRVADRHGSTVLEVIAAFACLHFAYGIGVWVGMVRFAPRWFIARRGTVPILPGESTRR